MKKKPKYKKEIFYKCLKCKDEIYWNTYKKLTYCTCKNIAVDGCKYYVRLIGNSKCYKKVYRRVYKASHATEKAIEQALKEYNEGKLKKYSNVGDLIKSLKGN